ncbi:hypothetical protein [Deinococcus roseus]|uniref:Uncharacterized protein n=1 Tax=Deinococcus roseus TaxID=392414 RepID=A0ABQ2CU52_9DEIO|nr:hypothetical protein [Deinococcus roseus]GGJ21220.1 hypothetical protein GCM10008938_04270 [Deinococcus roseus]
MHRKAPHNQLLGRLIWPDDGSLLYRTDLLDHPRDPQMFWIGNAADHQVHVMAQLDLFDLPVLQGGQEGLVLLEPFTPNRSYWLCVRTGHLVRLRTLSGFIDIEVLEALDSGYIEETTGTLDASSRDRLNQLVLLSKSDTAGEDHG